MPNPLHNTSRISLASLRLLDAVERRRGTFSALDLSRELNLPWEFVRNAIHGLVDIGKVWRATDGLDRYTVQERFRRYARYERLGRTAEPIRNCGHAGRRVERKGAGA